MHFEDAAVSLAMPDAIVATLVSHGEDGEAQAPGGGE
jgi:hypothetical protein